MRTANFRKQYQQTIIEQALLAFALGLVSFFVLAVLSLFAFQIWYLGRIYPGVTVNNVDIGGMNPHDAAEKLSQSFTYAQSGHILLTDQAKTWAVNPAEMGLFLNPEITAESAFYFGRRDGLLRRLEEQFGAHSGRRTLSPNLIFDQRMAFQYLTELAKEVDQPLVEPSLSVEGTEVTIHAGQSSRQLDIPATLEMITRQMQTLQDGIIPLRVIENHPTILDVGAQAEIARRLLSEPLTLTLPPEQEGAGPWPIPPETLAGMLVFEHAENVSNPEYRVALNEQKLRSYLAEIAPQLKQEPADARFIFNDDTGQLELIQPSVIGRMMDIENSIRTIQKQALQGEHSIPLELVLTPPRVSDDVTAEQLGISGLLHSEISYFYGSSPERIQNIQAAAARFHGLLVAPGETFSMAAALGNISLDNGYVEALIIHGNQTIKGVGGGVCQVSTTLFRTAFFSGFPISERHAHAYRVSYYEKTPSNQIDPNLAGLDATVFVPLVDLKFTNDTPDWLLMETYVNPTYSTIIWKFYSTPDGRFVQWETTGPVNIVKAPKPLYRENPDLPKGEVKQMDWAADGADITITRRVYKNEALYFQDTFQTHYKPWQAIYDYGPGTEGMPPPQENE